MTEIHQHDYQRQASGTWFGDRQVARCACGAIDDLMRHRVTRPGTTGLNLAERRFRVDPRDG
ncbi:MAG: hypothetical protein ACREN1_02470 [Candidatus Dormibacteria bacterium]